MSTRDDSDAPGRARARPGRVEQDWATIWRSELAAMAADRELREWGHLLLELWTAAAGSAPARRDDVVQRSGAGPAQPAGPSPAAAASDAVVDEIERLRVRVDRLERLVEHRDGRAGRVA